MTELYLQKFGNKRVIQIRGWTQKDALLRDLKTGLDYAMAWDVFFMHHEKIEDFECDVSDYVGPDLTIE